MKIQNSNSLPCGRCCRHMGMLLGGRGERGFKSLIYLGSWLKGGTGRTNAMYRPIPYQGICFTSGLGWVRVGQRWEMGVDSISRLELGVGFTTYKV